MTLWIQSVKVEFLFTDGFSAGAALGPLLAGLISPTGWNNVFYMLISADVLACVVRRSSMLSFIHLKLLLVLKIQLTLLWFVSSFFPGLCSRRFRVGVECVYPRVEGKHHQRLSGLWCLDLKMTAFSFFFPGSGSFKKSNQYKKGKLQHVTSLYRWQPPNFSRMEPRRRITVLWAFLLYKLIFRENAFLWPIYWLSYSSFIIKVYILSIFQDLVFFCHWRLWGWWCFTWEWPSFTSILVLF